MIDIVKLVYTMIFAPFVCALILALCKFAKIKLPQYGNFALSLFGSILCLALSLVLFEYNITYQGYSLENNFAICTIQNIILYFGIYADNLSCILILFLSLFFFITNIFSYRYLVQNRQGFARFFIYLNLMQFFAYCFFISSNLIQSSVFMIMQSLILYLFTNFYFQKPVAQENSKKVFELNIAADFIFFCACCAFLYFSTVMTDTASIPTLAYNNINSLGLYSFASLNPVIFILICTLFILGAVIKSAQFPFSRSVSLASQAPDSAFSIIISPIIISQGTFLLLRLFPLLNLTSALFEILKIIGIITAIFAGLSAAKENEIKHICAKMAISQSGIALCALGFKMYDICIFYILASGLTVGLISYTLNIVSYSTGSQDNIKFLGGLREKLPFAATSFLIGAISLSGFMFSGFYSRAYILDNLYNSGNFMYLAVFLIYSFITAFYSFRLYFRVFEGKYRGTFVPKVSGRAMSFAIAPLIILTIFFGYIYNNFANSFFANLEQTSLTYQNPFVNVFAFLTAAAGYYLAYNIYFTKRLYSVRLRFARKLAAKYFYAENFLDFILKDILVFFSKLFSFFEKHILGFLYKLPVFISKIISYVAMQTEARDLNTKFFRVVLYLFLITFLTCLIYFKTGVIR